MSNETESTNLLHTALYDLHIELGARMVPFAGYAMPVQYPLGVMKEHLHTRTAAGLFDVSHMGQVSVTQESIRKPGLYLLTHPKILIDPMAWKR